jgi:hypothetical protein
LTGLLFVVSRDQPQLYEYLVRSLSGYESIEVIMDRRRHDRRRMNEPRGRERRRTDRRVRPHEPAQFFPLGYTIVRRPARRTWLRRLTAATRG